MPQNKFALMRYRLIDSMLHRYEYVKTSSIAECCIDRTGYKVSVRTIQMDIEAMRHDPFLAYYAPIGYNNMYKAYFYEDRGYRLHHFRFSEEELALMEDVLVIIRGIVPETDYGMLEKIINKMRYGVDGEIKFRHLYL